MKKAIRRIGIWLFLSTFIPSILHAQLILVDGSSFRDALFLLGDGKNTSPNPLEKAHQDASRPIPPSSLYIWFEYVDLEEKQSTGAAGVFVDFSKLEIEIDESLRGMLLYYERDSSTNPERVVLYVPSEGYKWYWENTAALIKQQYEEEFRNIKKAQRLARIDLSQPRIVVPE